MKNLIIILTALLIVVSCKQKKHDEYGHDMANMEAGSTYYTCSMHPQIVANKPGKCPICHMDLVAVKKDNNEKDILQLSDQQIQLGNIHTDTVKNGNLADQLITTGILNFDQDKKIAISARVMGRIEKLYYKNNGEFVQKGAPVFAIYSEELNNAKQEYIHALERAKTFENGAVTVVNLQQLVESAKNKLLLWGMTESQIKELAQSKKSQSLTTYYSPASGYIVSVDVVEGGYVMEGSPILNLASLSTLWAEAQVYISQMSAIAPDSKVVVKIPDMGNIAIEGHISFINPEVDSSTRINLVRISIPNKNNMLRPGMPAYILFQQSKQSGFFLPTDAVLRDGKSANIWVQVSKGKFKNKMVKTGLETGGKIEILSGLVEGDVVVTSGVYLLNSEYVFKNGADPMAGHDMKKM